MIDANQMSWELSWLMPEGTFSIVIPQPVEQQRQRRIPASKGVQACMYKNL